MNSLAGRAAATTLPSRMTITRLARREDLAEEMRDQDHAPPPATNRRTKARSCPATMRVERRGRLVEDDELHRRVGDREGAGDLDHLPPRDAEVADHVAAAQFRGRERFRRACRGSAAPSAAASRTPAASHGRRGHSPPPSGSGRATVPGRRSGCRGLRLRHVIASRQVLAADA